MGLLCILDAVRRLQVTDPVAPAGCEAYPSQSCTGKFLDTRKGLRTSLVSSDVSQHSGILSPYLNINNRRTRRA